MVFADGTPESQLMLVGEAPGREEDLKGLPFVGESGKLLDRMMASIGRDRTSFYITNVLPWRPPGNRNPTQEEIALFLPFVRHHIALVLGNISAKTLFDTTEGITRMRGKWREIAIADQVIPAMATYHPAFLLRQPGAKREAWRDLLSLEARLAELKI
jgi:DNA polymerase